MFRFVFINQCSSTQPENLHWLLDTDIVQGNDNKLCTELDSGVLSDSAIELHRRSVSTHMYMYMKIMKYTFTCTMNFTVVSNLNNFH